MCRPLSDRLWTLRDTIAEMRKERRKILLGPQPLDDIDMEILEDLDEKIDVLEKEHEILEAQIRALRGAVA